MLTEPTRPEAGDVAFVGWYKDKARTEKWNLRIQYPAT